MTLRIPRRKRKIDSMLSLYRRYTKKCPHRSKGVRWVRCNCPVHVWGALPNGEWIRKAVGTKSMSQARRTVELWERDQRTDAPPTIDEATEAFLLSHEDSARATRIKYLKIMRFFRGFCETHRYEQLAQLEVESFDAYRQTRKVAPLTWTKELQVLRSFCEFCCRRKWMTRNIARDVEMPKGIPPADREPYTEEEMVAILNACDVIGQRPYERLRARAMVLLMRYTGLSIRNTFLLRRDQIHDGRLEVRRAKNGKPIYVPVMLNLQAALDAVPVPRRAQDPNCPYFFYSGRGGIPIEYAQRSAEGTMNAVFRRSGVQSAKTHRFRHTLATRMLEQGASYEDVAAVLGNSARIVEKHYAKWSKGRQERIDRYFLAAHGVSEGLEVVQ